MTRRLLFAALVVGVAACDTGPKPGVYEHLLTRERIRVEAVGDCTELFMAYMDELERVEQQVQQDLGLDDRPSFAQLGDRAIIPAPEYDPDTDRRCFARRVSDAGLSWTEVYIESIRVLQQDYELVR